MFQDSASALHEVNTQIPKIKLSQSHCNSISFRPNSLARQGHAVDANNQALYNIWQKHS